MRRWEVISGSLKRAEASPGGPSVFLLAPVLAFDLRMGRERGLAANAHPHPVDDSAIEPLSRVIS